MLSRALTGPGSFALAPLLFEVSDVVLKLDEIDLLWGDGVTKEDTGKKINTNRGDRI